MKRIKPLKTIDEKNNIIDEQNKLIADLKNQIKKL